MMGRRKSEQGQLFYVFDLDAAVPGDHLARRFWTSPGCAKNSRRTIHTPAGPRSIRSS